MKIALHNPFYNKPVAEAEIAQRISKAASNIGHEAIEFGSSAAIREYEPDFVLAMHHRIAKLTYFPTYGCMWNPKTFIKDFMDSNIFLKNILSYDAYLYSSCEIRNWLSDYLYTTPKNYFFQSFYASCYTTEYHQPNLTNVKLFYCGTNWDGYRFEQLFLELEKTNLLKVYGPGKSWDYLKHAYQGELPFDGHSILERINGIGVGLCLHKQEHLDSNTPSMRIFEVVAAGALAICDNLPFIRESFGDSVFYIDNHLDPEDKKQEILKILEWIQNNQLAAQVKSRNAHNIFCKFFSLEVLLGQLITQHQRISSDRWHKKVAKIEKYPDLDLRKDDGVEIIMRVGKRPLSMIERALNSVRDQTYKNISVLLVEFNYIEGLDDLVKRYNNSLSIRKVRDPQEIPNRSSTLWSGLNQISQRFFGILDDDDVLHANHIATLMTILEMDHRVGVAYSGSIKISESDEKYQMGNLLEENASLAFFEPFSVGKLWGSGNFITSNSFIARASLLDMTILQCPNLEVFEDYFLLLYLSSKTLFRFSFEASCSFFHRASLTDNSVYINRDIWSKNMERIKTIFRDLHYPLTSTLSEPFISSLGEKYLQISSEFELMKEKMIQINSEFELMRGKYIQINSEFELMRGKYIQINSEFELMRGKMSQINSEITDLRLYKAEINAMKSSKFWKLREIWLRIKSLI